ncbi:unnamed protein product [Cuscuta epithymum]|uniref:Uncharacterized protein n=1 Tax=Cuscuta epithymum TaxID=186058 RepID=A0AAV0FD34_9ASTE|nr:unnamed protein product [Cuscuta epithymum]
MGEPNRGARYDGTEGPIALHKTFVAILEGMGEPNRESGHDGAEGPIALHKTFVATLEGMDELNVNLGDVPPSDLGSWYSSSKAKESMMLADRRRPLHSSYLNFVIILYVCFSVCTSRPIAPRDKIILCSVLFWHLFFFFFWSLLVFVRPWSLVLPASLLRGDVRYPQTSQGGTCLSTSRFPLFSFVRGPFSLTGVSCFEEDVRYPRNSQGRTGLPSRVPDFVIPRPSIHGHLWDKQVYLGRLPWFV